MKTIQITLAATLLLLSACETKTGTGALAGAGLGAASGALISGSATGAVIGGAVGAVAGGLVGAALDEQDRKIMEQRAPRTLRKLDNGQQLTLRDIKNMSKAGISDKVIISQINATESTFDLDADDIINLKEAGVSQRVIDAMIQSGD